MRDAILCILRGYEKVRLNRNAQLNFDIGFFPTKKDPIKPTFMLIAIENAIAAQKYTYRVLQKIKIKLILLCVSAEPAILGSAKTALEFKYEI